MTVVDVTDQNRLEIQQERVFVRVLLLEDVKGLQVQRDRRVVLGQICINV